MKSHIGPEGPSRCSAEPGNCPFEDSEDAGANHFNTIKEAREEWETRLSKAYDTVSSVSVTKRKLSEKEKELRAQNAKIAKQLVEARSESTSGIVYEDANPERAKRRLNEAIEFAESRHNEQLVQKLSKSTVLPSGAFKTAEGKRVNTDKILQTKLLIKHVESERSKALNKLTELVRSAPPEGEKFSLKTDGGTYSLTVSKGMDEDAFEKLPKGLQEKCSSEKDSLNIDLARENIPPAKLRQITTESQVLDYVYGKEPDVGQRKYKVSTDLKGETTDAKLESGLKNIADFYDTTTKAEGKLKGLNTYVKEGGEAIKVAASKTSGNTFIPARSQYNGGLVSGRTTINPKLAKEVLTEDELKSITVKKLAPDTAKAQSILPSETFGKIFEAKKVSLRVTEKKD